MRIRRLRGLDAPAVLCLSAGVALRLRARPPTVADVDGVNFARGLAAFDPLHQAPHLPGYGPYVAASKLFAALGADTVWALALPGLVAWVLGAALLYTALRRHLPRPAPEAALVTLSLAPGVALFGAWPTSDGFGLGLWLLALGAIGHAAAHPPDSPLGRRWRYAAGAFGGLMLGARASWWPLALVPALLAFARPAWGARRAAALALGLGALAVLGPLAAALGPVAAAEGLLGFGAGHFTTWGGAAHEASTVAGRLTPVAWGLWTAQLGAWSSGESWLALPLTGLLLAAGGFGLRFAARAEAPEARLVRGLALVCAAYLLWVLLGQNVDKPRHLLPLAPLVAVLVGAGLAAAATARRTAAALPLALAAAFALVSVPRAFEQARLAPAPRLVQHVLRNEPPQGVEILAGEEARVFEHLAPAYRVLRPASAEVTRREAARAHASGVRVLVTSGAAGAAGLQGSLTEVMRAETPRAVRAHDHTLVLYRYDGEPEPGRFHAER